MIVLASACSQGLQQRPPASRHIPAAAIQTRFAQALDTRGPEAAAQLTQWYGRTDLDCGNPGRPAVLCGGVLLRATETHPAFLPWDPSPGSIASGGVSFSWLRQDNNFANLVYNYRNGFIFYPVFDTPSGKNSDIQVLCAFPMDADTNARSTLQGCGPTPDYSADSRPCTDQGIDTAAQWLAKFNRGNDRYHYQCGWSVREGERDQAAKFIAAIEARRGMDDPYWDIQNELRVATWAPGQGATLPIQSFFYLAGDADARTKAQTDQQRYFDSYGQTVPIVRLQLPASKSGAATFTYDESDQGGSKPGDLVLDTSPVVLSGKAYIITARPDIVAHLDASNSVTRTPASGHPPYTYRSSDPSIAVVSGAGQVTPIRNGTVMVTVGDSTGASASYSVTFTQVVQVRDMGSMTHAAAVRAAAANGEHLPSAAENGELRRAFAGKWPYSDGYYWTTQTCLTGYTAYHIFQASPNGYCYAFVYARDTVGLK